MTNVFSSFPEYDTSIESNVAAMSIVACHYVKVRNSLLYIALPGKARPFFTLTICIFNSIPIFTHLPIQSQSFFVHSLHFPSVTYILNVL